MTLHNCELYHKLGYCYGEIHNYEESINWYLKALELSPNDSTIHDLLRDLAQSYFKIKNYNEAIKFYTKCLEFEPENANIHGLIGVSYDTIQTDDDDEAYELKTSALSHFEQALKYNQNNNNIIIHINIGGILMDILREDEAIEHFKKALELVLSFLLYYYK